MSVAIRKLEGIEHVEVSLEKASALIVFKAENTVTLAQIRDVIRKSGYPTRDAQITARGRIAERAGTPVLDLLNGSVLELVARPPDAPSGPAEITGVSRQDDKKIERLTVTAIK